MDIRKSQKSIYKRSFYGDTIYSTKEGRRRYKENRRGFGYGISYGKPISDINGKVWGVGFPEILGPTPGFYGVGHNHFSN